MNKVRSARRPIIIGFSLMLALLLGMGALGVNYMRGVQQRLDHLVQFHNTLTRHFNTLRTVARERSLILYQMNLRRDRFFTEESKERMSALAGQFIDVREQLRQLAPPRGHGFTLEDIMPEVSRSTSLQRDVVTLLEQERYDEADRLLSERSLPAQNALLAKYDELVAQEQQRAESAAAAAEQDYRLALYSMLALGALLVGLGLFISVFVVRRVTRGEDDLRLLNLRLEERVIERTGSLTVANRDLARTLEDLRRAQSQLVQSEKMAALGSLVAGIAHEVNTPIGVAMTAVTHQQEQTVNLQREFEAGAMTRSRLQRHIDDARQAGEMIYDNLRRASGLIASFKRVAVDQSQDQWETIDLRDYLDDTIRSLQPRFKHSPIEIENDCAPGLQLHTHPGAIYQIISNLMLNSLSHAFDPGAAGQIHIACACQGDHLLLSYSDNGKGMSEAEGRKAFDPFFTTKRGRGGSGLGLHIVYNLVTAGLGGSIALHSTEGQGARFDIELPMDSVVRQRAG